jgi:hypothetical protein
MSGEDTVRTLRAEREAKAKRAARIAAAEELESHHAALKADRNAARMEMSHAGFDVPSYVDAQWMVKKLLARNADQKKLEDGLRERLKAAEGARVIEADTRRNHCHCPFRGGYHAMFCLASYDPDNGYDACRVHASSNGHCRLDEGPILVKKAGEERGESLTDAMRRADNIIGRALIEAVRNYEAPTGNAEEDSGGA